VTTARAEQARRGELARIAYSWVHRAVNDAVEQTGGQLVPRPVIRGRADLGTVRHAGPADGLVAARAMEIQARTVLRIYIRDCREAAMGWKKIGELLNLEDEAKRQDISVAEAAFGIAAGPRESSWSRTYGRSFRWDCSSCGKTIGDEGPEMWPGDLRDGHARGCRRVAAEIRAYNRAVNETG
jgi:hypothetical protein